MDTKLCCFYDVTSLIVSRHLVYFQWKRGLRTEKAIIQVMCQDWWTKLYTCQEATLGWNWRVKSAWCRFCKHSMLMPQSWSNFLRHSTCFVEYWIFYHIIQDTLIIFFLPVKVSITLYMEHEHIKLYSYMKW